MFECVRDVASKMCLDPISNAAYLISFWKSVNCILDVFGEKHKGYVSKLNLLCSYDHALCTIALICFWNEHVSYMYK